MSGFLFTWACIMATLAFFAYKSREKAESIPVNRDGCWDANEGRNAAIVVSCILFSGTCAATVGCLVGSIFA